MPKGVYPRTKKLFCKRGHDKTVSGAVMKCGRCAVCVRERNRKYKYGIDRREYNRRYRDAHRAEIAACKRKYYLENKGAVRDRSHKYYLANKDKIMNRSANYAKVYREQKLKYAREYRQSHESWYVSHLLARKFHVPRKDIPDEAVVLWRAQLIGMRLMRQYRKEQNESKNVFARIT